MLLEKREPGFGIGDAGGKGRRESVSVAFAFTAKVDAKGRDVLRGQLGGGAFE